MPIQFTKTTHPIDFSKLSGNEFERLVFATLLRMRAWDSLSWHGQVGADGGRDIVGICEDEYGQDKTVVVACANWRRMTVAKAASDIKKLVKSMSKAPDEAIVVAGGTMSADAKKKIADAASAAGIGTSLTWSGTEFEEHLRFHAPSVLQRFVNGEELPDSDIELRRLMSQLSPVTSTEAAEMLSQVFCRPAFQTAIHQESSLPAFNKAIGDTIGALNTGIWRDREGATIGLIPRIPEYKDPTVVHSLRQCVNSLVQLRVHFDEGMRTNAIRAVGTGGSTSCWFYIDSTYQLLLQTERDNAMRYAEQAIASLRNADAL